MVRWAGRVAWFAGSLLIASLIVFALLNLLPGDLAGVMLGPNASPEAVEALRAQLGLDRPLLVRYLEWIGGLFSGQLGTSALTGQPIAPIVAGKFGVTLSLVVFGMFFAVAIALPLGIHSALRRHRADGVVVSGVSQFGMAIPAFVVGIGLSLVFGYGCAGCRPTATSPPANRWLAGCRHLVLPAITLGLVQGAVLVGTCAPRSSMC